MTPRAHSPQRSRLPLRFGNFSLTLTDATVLRRESSAQSRWCSGNLGRDVLGRVERVAVDFATMRLRLE